MSFAFASLSSVLFMLLPSFLSLLLLLFVAPPLELPTDFEVGDFETLGGLLAAAVSTSALAPALAFDSSLSLLLLLLSLLLFFVVEARSFDRAIAAPREEDLPFKDFEVLFCPVAAAVATVAVVSVDAVLFTAPATKSAGVVAMEAAVLAAEGAGRMVLAAAEVAIVTTVAWEATPAVAEAPFAPARASEAAACGAAVEAETDAEEELGEGFRFGDIELLE